MTGKLDFGPGENYKFWPKRAKALAELREGVVTLPYEIDVAMDGLTVTFTLTGVIDQQRPVEWYPGDGTGPYYEVSETPFVHTYPAEGIYLASADPLTATWAPATVPVTLTSPVVVPAPEPQTLGPFTTEGREYYIRTIDWAVALDTDDEPGPDLFFPPSVLDDPDTQITAAQRAAVKAKLRANGWPE